MHFYQALRNFEKIWPIDWNWSLAFSQKFNEHSFCIELTDRISFQFWLFRIEHRKLVCPRENRMVDSCHTIMLVITNINIMLVKFKCYDEIRRTLLNLYGTTLGIILHTLIWCKIMKIYTYLHMHIYVRTNIYIMKR